MRCIALEVHRDFCQVAIAEAGQVRLAGGEDGARRLELFARSLAATVKGVKTRIPRRTGVLTPFTVGLPAVGRRQATR
jgi:hypothetical protein